MAKKLKSEPDQDPDPSEWDQEAAHAILGKFLGKDFETVRDLFDQVEDPIAAAAVAVRVCYELDPTQIAEFLALLEDDSLDDAGEDGDGEEDDGDQAKG